MFMATTPTVRRLSFRRACAAALATALTFDSGGQITGIELPGSGSNDVTIAYSSGVVTSVTTAAGAWSYAQSCPASCTTTVTDPGSHSTVYGFDPNAGQISSVTDALGRSSNRTFLGDGSGRVATNTTPAGVTTTYTYDDAHRGNVTAVATSATGMTTLTTTMAYPSSCTYVVNCNKPTTVTSADGVETDYTYDNTHGGVLTSTTNSVVTTTTYSAVHAWYKTGVSTISDGGGIYKVATTSTCITGSSCSGTSSEEKSSLTFQSGNSSTPTNGLPLSVTTGAGGGGGPTRTSAVTYDEFSRTVSVDGPLSGSDDSIYSVFHAWDGTSAWTETIGADPDGGGSLKRTASRTTYDIKGRVVRTENATVTDTAGSSFTTLNYATVAYDSASRPIAVTSYNAGGTTLALVNTSYNAVGQVECSAYRMNPSVFGTPAAACTLTTAGPDGLHDKISKTLYNADGQATSSYASLGTSLEQHTDTTYKSNGLVDYVTDANGNKTSFDYDGFGRSIKTSYPSKTTPGSVSTTDYSETVYDTATGRVSESHLRDQRIVKPTYDGAGRITEQWVGRDDATLNNDEFKLDTTYDQLGRVLTRSTVTPGPVTATATFTYDALNLLSVATPLTVSGSPSTATVSYTYDAAGRRATVTYPSSLTFTYDWAVTSLTDIKQSTDTIAAFAYDQLGRRTSMTRASGALVSSYSYDDLSRLSQLQLDLDSSTTTNDLTRTFSFNQASQITGRSSTNGAYAANAPSGGTTSYSNNGLNEMTAAGGASITYDARGNLTYDGTNTNTFDLLDRLTSVDTKTVAYDPLGNLAKLDTGTSVTQYVYDGNDLIAEYDGNGTLQRQYVHGPGSDEPLVWYEGSGTGTKKNLVADERGSIVAVTDASGSTLAKRTYDEYGKPDSGAVGQFGYTGQVWLPDLGLYNYKARFYSPVLGRFLSSDPIGYGGGMNMYAYVGGDPINMSDPRGTRQGPSGDGIDPCQMGSWGPECGGPPVAMEGDAFGSMDACAGVNTPDCIAHEQFGDASTPPVTPPVPPPPPAPTPQPNPNNPPPTPSTHAAPTIQTSAGQVTIYIPILLTGTVPPGAMAQAQAYASQINAGASGPHVVIEDASVTGAAHPVTFDLYAGTDPAMVVSNGQGEGINTATLQGHLDSSRPDLPREIVHDGLHPEGIADAYVVTTTNGVRTATPLTPQDANNIMGPSMGPELRGSQIGDAPGLKNPNVTNTQ